MNHGVHLNGFIHDFSLWDKKTGECVHREVKCNRIPQEGLDFLIQAPFGLAAPIPALYCGLFRNDYVPVAGTSALDIPSNMGEFVDYSEATRPAWTYQYNDLSTIDNVANKAVFTPTQERVVYGSFIVSSPVKGGNQGIILSAVRYATVKTLSPGLEAKLVCGLTYIPTNS